MVRQIENFDKLMNDELKNALTFAKEKDLFENFFPPEPEIKDDRKNTKLSSVHPEPEEKLEAGADAKSPGPGVEPGEQAPGEPPPDTSAEDLVALDKFLKTVAGHKKKIASLTKKLDKMEDLSQMCAQDRGLLQGQLALQAMLREDFDIIDWALNNTVEPVPPDI